MSSLWLRLVVIIHCIVLPTAVNAESAFVRPNTSVTCANSQQPCRTFNEYVQQAEQYFVDDTTFLFLPGTHELDIQLDLEGLSNISFAPLDEANVEHDVQLLVSLSVNITWTNCKNIELNGLVFVLSGQDVASDLFFAKLIFQETTALLSKLTLIGNGTRIFASCNSSDIEIGDLLVENTNATILYAFNSAIDFYGQNLFSNNNMSSSDDGNMIVLLSCRYSFSGSLTFVDSTVSTPILISSTPDGIENISGNLSFVNNTFRTVNGAMVFNSGTNHITGNILFVNNTYPDGGSQIQLYETTLYIAGNISFIMNEIHVTVESYVTGGAAIFLFQNSTLFINGRALFRCNRAIAPTELSRSGIRVSGGAIYATHESRVTFEESSDISFIENFAASYGGAMAVVDSNLTMYGRVSFESNSADLGGGAITVNSSRDASSSSVISCSGKSIIFRNNTSKGSGGAIYAGSYSQSSHNATVIVELRDVLFEGNTAVLNGGATYSFNSITNMTGTVDFNYNSAQRGGAMAFSGTTSKLHLTEPLTTNFVENSATLGGGAIFIQNDVSINQLCSTDIQSQILFLVRECFIELSSEINIRLNFENNNASSGRIFYGGNLDTCTLLVGGMRTYNALETIASLSNVNVNIISPNEEISNISSDPVQVCICKRDRFDNVCNSTEIETVRGKEVSLQAVIIGQSNILLGQTSRIIFPSAVRISLDNGVQISAAQRVQPTGSRCTNISYRFFAESDTTVVTLFPDNGPCRDFGIARTLIRVKFLPCPNGFVKNGSECVCDERLQLRFSASCNVDDSSIQWSSPSNRFWMGALYENDSNESTYQGLILHAGCPFDYCVNTPIPITLSDLTVQCNYNHSGTLCGSCREGYSIALGSLHCLRCSNEYLALLLPFALAGIVLTAILLLQRLTVAAGTINGLIFYANVVHTNQFVFFPEGARQILAWFNLDLGIETCFYDGMTTYAYTWLQFVFPFYVWFLIGLIIVATHYSTKLTRVFGKNPVAALATLFLLSYSKLLRTTIAAISFTHLEYPDGTSKLVWLYDGNVAYGQADHLVLVIFSVLILLFLFVPYTLLLFFAHWLQALSHWRILSWLNKIKPFTDAYHAPYKKQTRYWTGLLLFVRLLLFAFTATDSKLVPIIVTSVTAVLLALAWGHKGIYENRLNDLIEGFFLVNLCIFSATINQNVSPPFSHAGIGYFFVGIALVAYSCILGYHIYLRIADIGTGKNTESKDITNTASPDDDRDLTLKSQKPTQTFVELREPLLEQ